MAGELAVLNTKTPHEQWRDIVVSAGIAVINYARPNSLARDWAAITFHQPRQ